MLIFIIELVLTMEVLKFKNRIKSTFKSII
jgi:hypothetical protein